MNWAGSTLDLDGTPIHVRRGGVVGAPAVVFCHGFSDDGACWSRFADVVADRYDVIAVDARNHGRSGRGPADWAILADDLVGVIERLDLDRPTLVGHSLGASTVALAAARSGLGVARAVLEDPPWRVDPAPIDEHQLAGVRAWVESLSAQTLDELRGMGRERHPRWPDIEFDTWAPAKLGLGPLSVEHLVPLDWESVVAAIECPILVVLGDPSLDAIATPRVGERIAELHADTDVVTIADAGHNIRRERLDAFAAAVVPFLP